MAPVIIRISMCIVEIRQRIRGTDTSIKFALFALSKDDHSFNLMGLQNYFKDTNLRIHPLHKVACAVNLDRSSYC